MLLIVTFRESSSTQLDKPSTSIPAPSPSSALISALGSRPYFHPCSRPYSPLIIPADLRLVLRQVPSSYILCAIRPLTNTHIACEGQVEIFPIWLCLSNPARCSAHWAHCQPQT